jgi:hypothetical protein
VSTIPGHLTHIVTYLQALLARILPVEHRPAAEGPPLCVILHNRVGRYAERIARLYALFLAGRLPRPAQAPRPHPIPQAARKPSRPRAVVPRAKFWLLRRGRHDIAAAGSRLQTWLERPDLPEFIAAAPQAGRHLRPLCHLLAVPLPPFLRLLARPRKPRPAPAASRRSPGRPSLHLPPGDRPFPPYVLAFARAVRKNGS